MIIEIGASGDPWDLVEQIDAPAHGGPRNGRMMMDAKADAYFKVDPFTPPESPSHYE